MRFSIMVDGKERAKADTKELAISIVKLLSRKHGQTVKAVDKKQHNHVVYYCEG